MKLKNTLKILVVNYEYPPIGGGGGVICRDIAEELVMFGHEVTVVTSGFNELPEKEIVNGVSIFRVPVLFRKKQNTASIFSMLSFVPNGIKKCSELIRAEKFDIINTHFAIPSGPVGNYISKKHNIPNVLSIHGGDIFDPSKKLSPHKTIGLKQTVRKMLNSASRVVAQSSDTQNNAKTYYQINRDIDIIPLGIKPLPKQKVSKSTLGIQENCFVFSTIGRLVRRKNIDDLLFVVKEISKNISCKLFIMGDGPEKENIKNKIDELKINNNVILLGRVSDLDKFKYLTISDLYLSTAMHEGFGIVFLEAMDFGVPVLCYNRGGQTDFLKDGITGFTIELNNKNLFIEKTKEILESSEKRKIICNYNKEYAKNFYITSIAKKYSELFQETIIQK